MTVAEGLRRWATGTGDPVRRKYVRNVVAHLGGLYGAKVFDLVVLGAVTRSVPMKQLGTVFLAEAIGGALFRIGDFGIFPVLFRRAAREEAGPALLSAATLARAAAIVVLAIPFAVIVRSEFPDAAVLATAIFVLSGGYFVHEPPRAVLAGRELFAVTASIGIVTKFVEATSTVLGLLGGLGVWAWVLGRALSNLGMIAGCYVGARRSVARFPSPSPLEAFREGLPFWFSSATSAALSQTDTFVVSAYLGTAETARLGIASRIIGGILSLVSSMTSVAFPELARQNRRFATPAQVGTVGVAAFTLTAGVLVLAPLGVRILTGRFDPGATSVVRALAPIVALVTVNRSLSAWLQAKNKERTMATINVAASVASALALFALVPAFGTVGAAFGHVVEEALSAAGLFAIAYAAAHRIENPYAWIAARLPGGTALVRARLEGVVTRRARAFLRSPGGIETLEISGSGKDPATFVPGRSDLDFIVTTRARGERLAATVRHCQRHAPARFVGPVHVQVLHPEVLAWARALGHPVLHREHTRQLLGVAPLTDEAVRDPASPREWALSHAVALAIRVQRDALEDSRHDGATRTDRIVKDFRFLLWRLERHGGCTFERLREEGFDLPAFLAPRPSVEGVRAARGGARPAWLTAPSTHEVLRAAARALSLAFEAETRNWPHSETPPRSPAVPAWLAELGERSRRQADGLLALGARAVELTPTGPTDDDPMLLVTCRDWSSPEWAAWQREALRAGRLRAPFRSYRWPVALPPAVLRADAYFEHAPLFHAARAAGRLHLAGDAIHGRSPPGEALHRAALRETVIALVRIPGDQTRLRREPAFAPSQLDDPTTLEAEWRFRVRAFVTGRLAALSLLLDTGEAPADRAGVAAAYAARYDDPLAAYMLENPAQTTGTRVADVLDEWAAGRLDRLSALLRNEIRS